MSFVAPPGYQAIYNPSIPYVGPINGHLKAGMSVYIHGVIPEEMVRFFVNLKCGESDGDNIALHFNPRFDGLDKVVLNSFQNGSWEQEQITFNMPFGKGKSFEMVIIVNSEGYQINVNWEEFCQFQHRLPLDGVSTLQISGEVSINTITITGGDMVCPVEVMEKVENPINNPTIPYVGPIYGGLSEGMSIYIQGGVPEKMVEKKFYINLECGTSEGRAIAFHFSRRFDGWDKVVLNSYQNGEWEQEEKISDVAFSEAPFSMGKDFGIVIVVKSDGYQVNVNDLEFCQFQHRIPLDRVSSLEIGGEVTIKSIDFTGGAYPEMGTDGKAVISEQPIYNPAIPLSETIPGGMRSNRTIIIRGMILSAPSEADRFDINLVVADSRDVALHFNPRIGEGLVVRNSQIGGSWGQEERELNFSPFQEGQYFDVSEHLCDDQKFTVFVNEKHLCDFVHRLLPFTQIDTLEIKGDTNISYVLL